MFGDAGKRNLRVGDMTRLACFLSMLLFVMCVLWQEVWAVGRFKALDDDTYETYSLSSEVNYVDDPSLSSVTDEEAYTFDPTAYDSYTVTDLAGSSGPEYAGTEDDVLSDKTITSPQQTIADADGFDLYWDDNESSTDPELALMDASFASSCGTGNPVDDCWRCDADWDSHRQALASCAVGFGRAAIGGKNGKIYVVTSAKDDNAANPAPGTLRYAVTRLEPLWIIFAYSMTIKLKNELMITSYKTIDGRGVTVNCGRRWVDNSACDQCYRARYCDSRYQTHWTWEGHDFCSAHWKPWEM